MYIIKCIYIKIIIWWLAHAHVTRPRDDKQVIKRCDVYALCISAVIRVESS